MKITINSHTVNSSNRILTKMLPFLTAFFFVLIFFYHISYAFFYYLIQLCFIQIKIISILIKSIG